MKNIILMLCIFIMLSLYSFSVESIIFENREDYLERLTENDVYFGSVRDIEYDNGLVYFLDFKYCKVIVVDFKSATLNKTLFRRGQGPYELMNPISLKVKNNKVFVLDMGFNGIKIVDLDGKPVNEFKTAGMSGRRNIDINAKGEIFVAEYNTSSKTYVSVYDLDGQKKRSLIKIDGEDKLPLERTYYKILLDPDENILVLFAASRELKKFTKTGKLLWEIKLKNKILDKSPNDDGVKVSGKGAINVSTSVFDIILSKGKNILIGHYHGGCVIDGNGILTNVIDMTTPESSMQMMEIIDNKLFNVLVMGNEIYLYNIKETKKW